MPDFKKLLSKDTASIKPPPSLPPGTYFGTITNHKFGESRFVNDQTGEKEGIVTFQIAVSHWDESIDANEVNEAGGTRRPVFAEFNLEDGKDWPLKVLLDNLGLSGSLDSTIPQTTGHAVMFEITRRMDKRPGKEGFSYADVRNVRAQST